MALDEFLTDNQKRKTMKRLILAVLIALPFASSATTFTCKAIQEGQIDSGSQKSSVETRLDVQDKSMKVSMGVKLGDWVSLERKVLRRCTLPQMVGLPSLTSTTVAILFSLCARLTTTGRPLSIRLVCVLRLKIRREQSRHFLLDAVKSGA